MGKTLRVNVCWFNAGRNEANYRFDFCSAEVENLGKVLGKNWRNY